MPPNSNFESQPFNPFSVNEDFKDNDQDAHVNFYKTQISSLDTSYSIPNEVKEKLGNFQQKIIFCPTFKHSQYEYKISSNTWLRKLTPD